MSRSKKLHFSLLGDLGKMKETAFKGPVYHRLWMIPMARFCCRIDRHISGVWGHVKIIDFMSPSAQDSDSCRNKNVVERAMGATLCMDSIWLLWKMVGPWFTQLFCWKTYKSRQGRDGDSWKRKNRGTEQKYCQDSIICVSFPADAVEIKVLLLSFGPENGQDSDNYLDLCVLDIASLALWLSKYNDGKYLAWTSGWRNTLKKLFDVLLFILINYSRRGSQAHYVPFLPQIFRYTKVIFRWREFEEKKCRIRIVMWMFCCFCYYGKRLPEVNHRRN